MTAESYKLNGYLKLCIAGDFGVGKTSILKRFVHNTFEEDAPTTEGDTAFDKQMLVDGETIKLKLYDTSGQERFKTVTSSHFNGAHGVLYVYNPSDADTFASLQYWVDEVKRYGEADVSQIVLSSKADITEGRAVNAADGKKFAEDLKMPYLETSSKTGQGIEDCFTQLVKHILARINSEKPKTNKADIISNIPDEDTKKGKDKKEKKKGGCTLL